MYLEWLKNCLISIQCVPIYCLPVHKAFLISVSSNCYLILNILHFYIASDHVIIHVIVPLLGAFLGRISDSQTDDILNMTWTEECFHAINFSVSKVLA